MGPSVAKRVLWAPLLAAIAIAAALSSSASSRSTQPLASATLVLAQEGPTSTDDLLSKPADAARETAIHSSSIVPTKGSSGVMFTENVGQFDEIQWQLEKIEEDEVVARSFAVRVSGDAAPTARLLSRAWLTADEIAPTASSLAWNVLMANPPEGVTMSGPTGGAFSTWYTFTASVQPISATTPIDYVWQASAQSTITHTADLTDTASFLWDATGPQLVTVTASNSLGTVTATQTITLDQWRFDAELAPIWRDFPSLGEALHIPSWEEFLAILKRLLELAQPS